MNTIKRILKTCFRVRRSRGYYIPTTTNNRLVDADASLIEYAKNWGKAGRADPEIRVTEAERALMMGQI
jgi:hypothetical protein